LYIEYVFRYGAFFCRDWKQQQHMAILQCVVGKLGFAMMQQSLKLQGVPEIVRISGTPCTQYLRDVSTCVEPCNSLSALARLTQCAFSVRPANATAATHGSTQVDTAHLVTQDLIVLKTVETIFFFLLLMIFCLYHKARSLFQSFFSLSLFHSCLFLIVFVSPYDALC
jgi:hypothetical protein